MNRFQLSLLHTGVCIVFGVLSVTASMAQAPLSGTAGGTGSTASPGTGTGSTGTGGSGTGSGTSDSSAQHASALLAFIEAFPNASDSELEAYLVHRLDQEITGGTGELYDSYYYALQQPEVQAEIARLSSAATEGSAFYADADIDPNYPATGPETPPVLPPLGPVPNNQEGCPDALRNCPVVRKIIDDQMNYVQVAFDVTFTYNGFRPPAAFPFRGFLEQSEYTTTPWVGFSLQQIEYARTGYIAAVAELNKSKDIRLVAKGVTVTCSAASAVYLAMGTLAAANPPVAMACYVKAAMLGAAASVAFLTAESQDSWIQFYCTVRLPELYDEATTGGRMPPQEASQRSNEQHFGRTEEFTGTSTSLPFEGATELPGDPSSDWVRIRHNGSSMGESLEEAINALPYYLRGFARDLL